MTKDAGLWAEGSMFAWPLQLPSYSPPTCVDYLDLYATQLPECLNLLLKVRCVGIRDQGGTYCQYQTPRGTYRRYQTPRRNSPSVSDAKGELTVGIRRQGGTYRRYQTPRGNLPSVSDAKEELTVGIRCQGGTYRRYQTPRGTYCRYQTPRGPYKGTLPSVSDTKRTLRPMKPWS